MVTMEGVGGEGCCHIAGVCTAFSGGYLAISIKKFNNTYTFQPKSVTLRTILYRNTCTWAQIRIDRDVCCGTIFTSKILETAQRSLSQQKAGERQIVKPAYGIPCNSLKGQEISTDFWDKEGCLECFVKWKGKLQYGTYVMRMCVCTEYF